MNPLVEVLPKVLAGTTSIKISPNPKDAAPKAFGATDSVAAVVPLTEAQRDAILVAIAQRLGILL